MRTQVGIVGAGPAGLMLSHLLHRAGIESVVLEARNREYVESRVRAGVLEQGSVDLLREHGLGERLDREGLVHEGINLQFGGERHRVPMTELTGRAITVYGQQEVVKDIIAARLAAGGEILFDVDDVRLSGLTEDQPVIRYTRDGRKAELHCDFIAGCDGFHGVSRTAVPDGVLTTYERTYPFAWLGILAEAAPSTEELIYCHSERGFALVSMRSPKISRLYLQVAPDEDVAEWPDSRVWEELHARLTLGDWRLNEGPVIDKGVTAMRSMVVQPMQWRRLFLAGDAVHIVPPTGAKGMNLALADVRVLGNALAAYYTDRRSDLLDSYSQTCLTRVWRAQHFSWWMTSMLHRLPGHDPYEEQLQLAQLRYVTTSEAYARSLSENYVGFPFD
jgi:p-hydroxybenzoate 3-monooxygenase